MFAAQDFPAVYAELVRYTTCSSRQSALECSALVALLFLLLFLLLLFFNRLPRIDDADPCSRQGSPCNEGATCLNLSNGNYRCLCPLGYHGDHCQESSNPCAPNPCLNQGKCRVNAGYYTCVCPRNYKVLLFALRPL